MSALVAFRGLFPWLHWWASRTVLPQGIEGQRRHPAGECAAEGDRRDLLVEREVGEYEEVCRRG